MLDKFIEKWSSLIALSLILIIQFLFLSGMFGEISLSSLFKDFYTILHLTFTVAANIITTIIATDAGIEVGIISDEFKKSNEANNKLNLKIQPLRREFTTYIRKTNQEIIEETKENFLMDRGYLSEDELTPKELKEYKKLKFTTYDVDNVTSPLYVEDGKKGRKIKVGVTFDANEHKRKGKLKKAFMGVITGSMTINLVFGLKSVREAFLNLLIVVAGILITYIMYRTPVVHIFKRRLPNQVEIKFTLWQGFEPRIEEFKQEVIKIDKIREQTKPIQLPYTKKED